MAAKNGNFHHTLPARPPLSSHQSNSVPSTPHQYPRDFRSRSRSPSPHAALSMGGHSPRSVVSEANHVPMTTLPKGRPTCKYETSAAFSRRRMQYDIGDAPLEKPKEEPKKTLDPHEEKKLSGDMRELYDRLYPSDESNQRRQQFVKKLEDILRKQWPGQEFKVHIFGSHANSLCTSESDVDICIQTPMKSLETMHMLAEALANNGMERVICIAAAKVPIVKIWDPVLKVAADMNVNNTLALENTRMIQYYVSLDARVRPLGLLIKHWAKQRILNDAGIGGTLSSYAWTCMILNFLQTRKPPILPALHQEKHDPYIAQDGTESGFSSNLDLFKTYGAANKETDGELLFQFFRHYAYEFNYESSVVSVREGKHITRKQKGWDGASKEGQWRLCIEEPFNISRNLGNSADSTAFRGIHLELRRAFDLLVDGCQLDKVCEVYQYPPEEKNIFKKPIFGPKPTLAMPTANNRTGRGGAQSRNGRNNGNRNPANGRRSSSGASFGSRAPYSPFVQSPPLGLMGADYMAASSIQQFQMYGLQIEQLKARFQQSQIQMAEQASRQQAHAGVKASGQGGTNPSATISPQKTPFLNGVASPQAGINQAFHPELFYHPGLESQQIFQQMPQDASARTSPSSPSLSASTPVRRTMQRFSLASEGGSMRSQSQPPRGITPQQQQQSIMMQQYAQLLSQYGIPIYAVPPAPSQLTADIAGAGFDPLSRSASMPVKDNSPKEYVGYYMPEPRRMPPQKMPAQPASHVSQFGKLPQIPQYSELAQRRNRPSQDLQLNVNGTKRLSRSPSPLGYGHQRTASTPLRGTNHLPIKSAPLQMSSHVKEPKVDSTFQNAEPSAVPSGLLIVNGSSYPQSSTIDSRSNASEDDLSSKDSNFAFTREDAYESSILSSRQQSVYESPAMEGHYSPPTYNGHPATGNGFSYYPSAFDGGEFSPDQPYSAGGMQAFPAFVDPGFLPQHVSNPRHEEDASILSPKSMQHSNPFPSRLPVPVKPAPIDTTNVPESSKAGDPHTAPLLSPVYETRTPSPTAHRRSVPSLNGILPPLVVNGAGPIVRDFASLPTSAPVNGAISGSSKEKDIKVNTNMNGSGKPSGSLGPRSAPVPLTPTRREPQHSSGGQSHSNSQRDNGHSTPSQSHHHHGHGGGHCSQQQPQNQQGRLGSTATSSTSGWQTSGGGRKKKNRQRSKSTVERGRRGDDGGHGGSALNVGGGVKKPEPLPVNESERKGG